MQYTKNTRYRAITLGGALLVGALLLVPHTSWGQSSIEALTRAIAEKEQQILTLQGELTVLRNELNRLSQSAAPSGGSNATPKGTYSAFSRALSRGSSGSDVEQLQRALNDLGHYPEAIFSGYYGALTEEAIKRFQVSRGIVSSGTPQSTGYGRFGPSTRGALNDLLGNSQSAATGSTTQEENTSGSILRGTGSPSARSSEDAAEPDSPYSEYVEFGRQDVRDDDAEREYVTIEIDKDAPSDVILSGWKIHSPVTSKTVTIGKLSPLFEFSRSAVLEEPRLSPGDSLVVVTGSSPMVQSSFRVNKCTGYLKEYYRFQPTLSASCPSPEEEAEHRGNILSTDDACYEKLRRARDCRVPDTSELTASLSGVCASFLINELNYNACVRAHRNDTDFWGDEWRLYLNRSDPLWREKREEVQLLDPFGNVVDSISY